MAMTLAPVKVPTLPEAEYRKRSKRFRFFQIVFALTYVGMVLDVITTAMGYARAGSSYEQNPLGGALIGNLGWVGLLAVLTAISIVAYVSCKIIQWNKGGAWARAVNIAFVILAAFRWLAVVTAVLYLLQPSQ
jgi:hypothetical protein